jgi:hypothetical protein
VHSASVISLVFTLALALPWPWFDFAIDVTGV